MFRRALTVTRQQPGQYVNGIWQPGSESTFTVRASVQPATPDDVALLPSGQENNQAFTLYSDTALHVANEINNTVGDVVDVDGLPYRAMARQPWQNAVVPHHKTVVVKE